MGIDIVSTFKFDVDISNICQKRRKNCPLVWHFDSLKKSRTSLGFYFKVFDSTYETLLNKKHAIPEGKTKCVVWLLNVLNYTCPNS